MSVSEDMRIMGHLENYTVHTKNLSSMQINNCLYGKLSYYYSSGNGAEPLRILKHSDVELSQADHRGRFHRMQGIPLAKSAKC